MNDSTRPQDKIQDSLKDKPRPTGVTGFQPTGSQRLRETILATASGGMAVALSTVLSLITLYTMPQGGSITPASMLPVLFFALAFGPVWGIGACAVYGLLQFIINPFTAHWASVILDYPLAFGLLGLAGYFAAAKPVRLSTRNILRRVSLIPLPKIVLAVTLGMLGRMISHVLSGVIFYAEFAGDQNPWIYSIIYNGTYMGPELVITCLLLIPMAAILRAQRHN